MAYLIEAHYKPNEAGWRGLEEGKVWRRGKAGWRCTKREAVLDQWWGVGCGRLVSGVFRGSTSSANLKNGWRAVVH